MLTADAYGVLPPIARLSAEGAMYHYLSGYTAKVAGTEKGVTEPSATFSTCFGAPFLPLNPNVYAKQLGERIAKYESQRVAGEHRLDRRPARRRQPHEDCLHARDDSRRALRRSSISVGYQRHPVFNIDVPTSCPDVPADVLDPRGTWTDKAAYDAQAAKLAKMFVENFKTFEAHVAPGSTPAPRRSTRHEDRGIGYDSWSFPIPFSSESSCLLRGRHRAGDPRPAADGHQDFLRLSHRVRRAAERARLSRCASACPARCRCSIATRSILP